MMISSGLGLAICIRVIETFLTTRPSHQRLHLLPTTRSRAKADATVAALERVVADLASGRHRRQNAPFDLVRPRGQGKAGAAATAAGPTEEAARALYGQRVAIEPVLLDLLSLSSVHAAAAGLVQPEPSGRGGAPPRVPRLDVVVCNAGVGGWLGVDWWGCARQMWREGVAAAVGRPEYKICDVGAVAGPQLPRAADVGAEPPLGKVFCANLFGHYVLVRALAPVLGGGLRGGEPARVVWVSTLEAYARWLDEGDVQALRSGNAYESSKRLTDVLALTAEEKRSAPLVARWLAAPPPPYAGPTATTATASAKEAMSTSTTAAWTPPRMYLSHPGICMTGIIPLSAVMAFFQWLTFVVVRLAGSPWHTLSARSGATAAVWLALEEREELDARRAEKVKWGSAVARLGDEYVLETEVEGLEDEDEGFEELGGRMWRVMEDLREGWEERMNGD